jgi:hypothetical protein
MDHELFVDSKLGTGPEEAWLSPLIGPEFELDRDLAASLALKIKDQVDLVLALSIVEAVELRAASLARRRDKSLCRVSQPASVILAPSGFGPAHVLLVVFATPGESQATEIA